ncbi:MAG: hypothetical protein JWR05_3681 [Mucilaginibacter sp.]|nr:hypothetical protein [Mucilaginibacter sp.]
MFWGHFEPLVEALERGVPVVVRWWEIAAFAAVDRGRSSLFVRLESDGRLAYVEPIRDGLNITGWRSIA